MENFIKVSANFQNSMNSDFWYETHERSFFPSSFIDKGKNIDKFVKKVMSKNDKNKKKFTRLDVELYTDSYSAPSCTLWVIVEYGEKTYRKSNPDKTLTGIIITEEEFYSGIREFSATMFGGEK
jgi:hypothetical protein